MLKEGGTATWLRAQWDRQALRWVLLGPVMMALGAALFLKLPDAPATTVLVGVGVVMLAAAMTASRTHARAAMLVAWMSAGFLSAAIRTELVASPVVAQDAEGFHTVEGVVLEIDRGVNNLRLRIGVRAMSDLPPALTPRQIRVTHAAPLEVAPGRYVRCRVRLSAPPPASAPGEYPFSRDAWFRQLGAVGFALGACKAGSQPAARTVIESFELRLLALRRAMAVHVAEAAGRGGGIAAAITTGDRSFISAEDNEALRGSGLAHLLSISGLHMALTGGVVFLAIRRLVPLVEALALRVPSDKMAAAVALLVCTAYLALSGGSVPTQRAYVMAAVGFLAKLLDRPALSMRSLALSMACVIALQPESVLTPGFQMSFAATAALIALFESWPQRPDAPTGPIRKAGGWIAASAATSLAASLATLPFALHHFGRPAPLGVVANIAASPIISFVTAPSAVAAAALAPLGAERPALTILGWSLEWVTVIARIFAPSGEATMLPASSNAALVLASAALIVSTALRGWGRLVALPLALGAALLWLHAPRVVGIVTGNGAVWLRQAQQWTELREWKSPGGMRPLSIPAELARKGGLSEPVPFEGGTASMVHEPLLPPPACGTAGRLTIEPEAQVPLMLDPCRLARQGGARILMRDGRLIVEYGSRGSRPWE